MRSTRCQSIRPLAATAMALALAGAPLPVAAGSSHPAAPAPGLRASIESSVRTAVAGALATRPAQGRAGGARASAQDQAGTQTDLTSPGFFRTTAGVITLVALGAGVGYAIYSTSHDRITSPAR